MHRDPRRQYSGHTVPNPQAHAVSHSVAQGDQRQFSDWPSNGFFTSQFCRSSPQPDPLISDYKQNLKCVLQQNPDPGTVL